MENNNDKNDAQKKSQKVKLHKTRKNTTTVVQNPRKNTGYEEDEPINQHTTQNQALNDSKQLANSWAKPISLFSKSRGYSSEEQNSTPKNETGQSNTKTHTSLTNNTKEEIISHPKQPLSTKITQIDDRGYFEEDIFQPPIRLTNTQNVLNSSSSFANQQTPLLKTAGYIDDDTIIQSYSKSKVTHPALQSEQQKNSLTSFKSASTEQDNSQNKPAEVSNLSHQQQPNAAPISIMSQGHGYPLDWNESFQKLIEMKELTEEERLEKYKKLTTLAKDFVRVAKTFGKIIISEKFLPPQSRTINPVVVGGQAGLFVFALYFFEFWRNLKKKKSSRW